MIFLRSNTAVIITVGPFYDKTDGVTIEGALTITNERITLTADTDAGSAPTLILDNITGATSGTANDLNYITNTDAGLMQLELAAADVNRVGRMLLSITDAANHVPVFHHLFVLPQVIYDWLTAGVAPLSPTTAGRTLDVSATGEAGVDWANVGSQTTAVNLSATTTNLVNTVTTYTGNSVQTGDSFARIGATGSGLTSLASQTSVTTIDDFLDTEIAAILADTNELQTDWVDGGRLDLILDARASQASVDTVDTVVDSILVDTAEIGLAGAGLTNINLPNQIMDITGNITGNLSGSVGSVTGAVGGAVASVTAGVTVTTNNDKTGYALTSGERTSVADALLDRDMSTGTDSGTATVRTVRQALRANRNRVAIASGTMTVYGEDDSTASWTAAITTASGNPITEIDPASS